MLHRRETILCNTNRRLRDKFIAFASPAPWSVDASDAPGRHEEDFHHSDSRREAWPNCELTAPIKFKPDTEILRQYETLNQKEESLERKKRGRKKVGTPFSPQTSGGSSRVGDHESDG